MNRSHQIGKAGLRARSSKAASIRQTLLESDELNEELEAPSLELSSDAEDWPELETDDSSDVETELGLLLNGASHR